MMTELTRPGSLSSSDVRGRRSGCPGLLFLLLLAVYCAVSAAIPTKAAEKDHPGVENMSSMEVPGNADVYLVRTKRFEDQRGSSSGYVYKTSGNGGPTSYVQFKTSYGPLKGSQTVNGAENVRQQVFALPADSPPIKRRLAKKEVDDENKHSDAEVFAHYEGLTHMETVDEDDDDDDKKESLDDGDEDVHYDEGHGSSNEDESSAQQGSKASSGYSNNESFAKGATGKHATENTAGSHSSDGARKTSSEVESGHDARAHSAEHAEKGGSHSHSESHKKGSKTSGYHKVYRKDEYKKDHTFYDEQDVKGHSDTYGSGHKEHAIAQVAFRKGRKHASGHQAAERAEKGTYDKGRYDHHDAGYGAQDGREEHHKDRAYYQSADGKHSYRKQAD